MPPIFFFSLLLLMVLFLGIDVFGSSSKKSALQYTPSLSFVNELCHCLSMLGGWEKLPGDDSQSKSWNAEIAHQSFARHVEKLINEFLNQVNCIYS